MIWASIPSPAANTIEIGPLTVHFYGIMIGIGVLVAAIVTTRRYEKFGGDSSILDRVILWTVILGFAGARLTGDGNRSPSPTWRGFMAYWMIEKEGRTMSELSPLDILGKKFAIRFRGYPPMEVHEYLTELARVVEGLLRERAELKQQVHHVEQELNAFRDNLTYHTMVHEQLNTFISGFHYDAHPMAMMAGVVGSLAAFYHDRLDMENPEHRMLSAKRMIAKMPTIAAACYRHHMGWPFAYPKNSLGYTETFLDMMFSVPSEKYQVSEVAAKAFDLLFILHADHEQNASTSTVRLVGSSGANPYACVAAGISALWGPAHGGANEAVLDMLTEIGDVSRVGKYINKAKDRNDPFRLMGFGHRVYKNYDPRARIIQKMCHEVLSKPGAGNDPMFELALRLEEIALSDDYFIERKLYPNVDFYSGIVMRAIGIPTNMFTVIFAIGRLPGWIAHWKEVRESRSRIYRPRQVYTGPPERDYVDMEWR